MIDHGAKVVIDVLDGEGERWPRRSARRRRTSTSTSRALSRFRAVGSIGRLRVAGFPTWLLWLLVPFLWLTGFKNRVLVLALWTTAFLSRGRAERAITEQQVFGRQALAPSVPGGEVVE